MNLVPGNLFHTFNSMAHCQINCHMCTCTNFVNDCNLYEIIIFSNFKCAEPSSSWHTFVRTCLNRIPAVVLQNSQIDLHFYVVQCTAPILVLVNKIRTEGYFAITPGENSAPTCGSWLGYIRMSVAQVASLDCLVMLPGRPHSKGGRIEFILAKLLGLVTYSLKRKGKIPL